jgi:CRISPR-associated endonuclease Csn1
MKKILGLDLGTNSIGAALINIPESINDFGKEGNIEWLGSRIIPVDAQYLNKWEAGAQAETKAAARRIKRGARRLKHRYKLRRTRLTQVLKVLGWLDESFPENFKKKMSDDENFKFRISDYLSFEKSTVEEATKLLGVENKLGELALPEDWIIYYLRKKALTEKISFSELARITYMMNQRRGFKSSRKDLKDENVEEVKWVEILKIKSISQETFEKNNNGNYKFRVTPYSDKVNSWTVEKKKKPEWEEKEFTFLITEKIETKKDGSKKITQNNPQIPKAHDWALCVTAQDNKIGNEYPGTYFFNGLVNSVKNKADFKIRQYAVYRSKYKKELEDIWKKQIELNQELKKINTDKTILKKVAEILYPTQTKAIKPKLNKILSHDLLHLISEDIIYYQRDLKSQKNSIGECQYEKLKGKDGETYGVKCTPKSSPGFQEFRIWQDIHNIRIFQKEGIFDGFEKIDIDVSSHFIDEIAKEKLFELFDTSKDISQDNIFKELNKLNSDFKLSSETHRINMFFSAEKKLSGNETKEYFRKIFRKCDYTDEGEILLTDKEKFYKLWSISYSISLNDEEKSKEAILKALTAKTNKKSNPKKIIFDLPANVALEIAKAPDIEKTKKYASYSSKTINKLLPLMRCGKYWDFENIHPQTKERINKIVKEGWDFEADKRTGELIKERYFEKQDGFKGLPVWMACYVAYNRHSERVDSKKYSDPKEFNIMEKLPNNSLRNPIVEQVIRETLFVVKDIWGKYGQPDEIHIELGRDLKKNAKEREKATKKSTDNFEEKQRIKKLLYELINGGFEQYINESEEDLNKIQIQKTKFDINPNPESPVDIDKFRIWKSTSGLRDTDFEKRIKDEKIPKQQEIKKYVLWLSQKCVSPYTGRIIPLSKLFDPTQYEIEHILPKGLIKNDGFDNLVIAEWGVNKAKDRQLGALFIKNSSGRCTYGGKYYKLLDYSDYVEHCKRTFSRKKLQNLLATEIPEDFVSRQINDTRYITRRISELLYPVAKGKKDAKEGEEKGGIVFTIGSITSELKKEWGLTKEWKKLIKPRFERLEQMTGEICIMPNKKDRNDIDYNIKENEQLDVKRIDHRHHALDALIIAATTIEHIRYLNSLNSIDTNEELLRVRMALVKGKIREFQTPWPSFTEEARHKLEETIVTFKSYNQVISKPQNKYTAWEEKNGKYEKVEKHQESNKKWMAVRKSIFKEPQGIIYIKEIITKSFRTPKEILDIVKLQMKRMLAQNTPAQKTASYIYDQEAREIVKSIIELSGGKLEAIEKHLKKFKPKYANGDTIYTLKIAVFREYAAKRVKLGKDFDHKKIDKIPYSEKSRIPKILHDHLTEYEIFLERKKEVEKKKENTSIVLTENDIKLSETVMPEPFSDEGLEALDKKIGMKIRMVTIKEDVGLKKKLNNKLMEADGNPYYVFYENRTTKERRGFTSLSSYDVIQRLRDGKLIAEGKGDYDTILLQTNDLVYVPTKEELKRMQQGISQQLAIDWNNQKKIAQRIYRVNDFSKSDIYFKPNAFSKAIKEKELHTSFDDKCARLIDLFKLDNEESVMIKDICIKIKVDRLGNIMQQKKLPLLDIPGNIPFQKAQNLT